MTKYTEDEYKNFVKGLVINRESLDEELIIQPNEFFHVSEAYTLAVAKRDQKKQELDILEAELDKEIRARKASKEEKVTDKIVEQEIVRDGDYQQVNKEYIQSRALVGKWESLKEAYKQRADMLKVLVNLYTSNYFGEITGSSERNEARNRFNERRSKD